MIRSVFKKTVFFEILFIMELNSKNFVPLFKTMILTYLPLNLGLMLVRLGFPNINRKACFSVPIHSHHSFCPRLLVGKVSAPLPL